MRKAFFILECIVMLTTIAICQETSGASNTFPLGNDTSAAVTVSIQGPPISFDVAFSEPSGNGYLDPGESGNIEVAIRNRGKAQARCLEIRAWFISDSRGLTIGALPNVPWLTEGTESRLMVLVEADSTILSQPVKVRIAVKSCDGLRCEPPADIEFETRAKTH